MEAEGGFTLSWGLLGLSRGLLPEAGAELVG
jgi:hypothetical protein